MMLAIRDSVGDLSPYMRKTAAHAIPKLYDLDPEQKDELVGVIERLLSDQTTLVVGSAVMAFEQVSLFLPVSKNFFKIVFGILYSAVYLFIFGFLRNWVSYSIFCWVLRT